MPISSTRPVSVYELNKVGDRELLREDHVGLGWCVAVIGGPAPDQREVLVYKAGSIGDGLDHDPISTSGKIHPTFDDLVESDGVSVKAWTRADYIAAHPDTTVEPLP